MTRKFRFFELIFNFQFQPQVQPMFYVPTTGNNLMGNNFPGGAAIMGQISGGQFAQGSQSQAVIPVLFPQPGNPQVFQSEKYTRLILDR